MELHNDFYQFGKVELELNDNELLPAFISDLNKDENGNTKVVLNFENNALPEAEYETTKIHLPLKVTENEIQQMKEGDQIEVYAKIGDAKKWIKGKIAFIYNEIFGVNIENKELKSKYLTSKQNEFKFNDKKVDLLISKCDVRPLNKTSKIISNPFFDKEIPFEFAKLEDLSYLNDQNVHQLFKKKLNAILVKYNSIKKCLKIIYYIQNPNSLSEIENVNRRTEMFANLHIKLLKFRGLTQMNLKKLIEKLNETKLGRELEEIKLEDDLYRLELLAPKKAIGLCIGRRSKNINKAKEIEGVKDVKFDNSKELFVITASTKEACLNASKVISYVQKSITVPKNFLGKLVGAKESTIQQLIEASVSSAGSVDNGYLKIESDDTGKIGKFIFAGSKESVDNAVELMRYYIASLYDIDRIRIKHEEVLNDLKEIEIYFPREDQSKNVPKDRRRTRSNANKYTKARKQFEKQNDSSKSDEQFNKSLNENINSSNSNKIESKDFQSNNKYRGNYPASRFFSNKKHNYTRYNRNPYQMNYYRYGYQMHKRPINQDYSNRMVSLS